MDGTKVFCGFGSAQAAAARRAITASESAAATAGASELLRVAEEIVRGLVEVVDVGTVVVVMGVQRGCMPVQHVSVSLFP